MVERQKIEPGYETRDINVRVVIWFAVILVGSAVVIHVALAGIYQLLKHRYPSPEPPSRISFHPSNSAPEPQLQVDPRADFANFEAEENARLNSYGWIDRAHGVIHIPIERAMELVAQRGLPMRGPGTQNSSRKTPEQLQQDKAAATATKQ